MFDWIDPEIRVPMKTHLHTIALMIALLLGQLPALHADELKLAALFSDHMVIQREQAVPVWGWAKPGEEISVEFAAQKKTAKANAEGRWTVTLDPLKASTEPRDLKVGSMVVHDVLVGDVWLCSGQSNMLFKMNKVANSPQEIAAANHPNLRFFSVKEQFARTPATDVKGAWKPISPATVSDCSAVAYYFAAALQEKIKVPIGLLVSSVGGTRIETWMRSEILASLGEADSLIAKWKDVTPEEFEKIAADYRAYQYRRDAPRAPASTAPNEKPAPPKPPEMRCHDCPGALHCGMIAPLQPFAIRGALWYQGEANSGRPLPYESQLPALIADWRKVWGENLPFLFAQLAPFKSTHPAFREAQLRIWQKTPNTAMVVTTDVGDANDIHPTRKRPVGERLALAARAISYGEQVEFSGPVFKGVSIARNRAVISFSHLGSGLMVKGDALKGFTIAGKDGKFVPAGAVIEGATVAVSSDKIAKPAFVRYGWAPVPDGNLFNRQGLPAVPFRTDAPATP